MDAWAWIIAKASELGKPVVINNSWGSHNGAHDGTAVEERALDDFAQLSGVAFVVAAGDDGNKAIHARSGTAPVAIGGTKSVAFVPTSTSASINLWYSADDNFSISLMHNGTQTAKAIKGGRTRSYSLDGATISISNCNSASTSNNLCQATVTLTGMTLPIRIGRSNWTGHPWRVRRARVRGTHGSRQITPHSTLPRIARHSLNRRRLQGRSASDHLSLTD